MLGVLLLHKELLHVDFQLISSPESVCDCSAGSLCLGRGLSSWCYRAFFPQERVGCFFVWVGCLVLERDVSCNFTKLSLQYVRGEVVGILGSCFDINGKCWMPVYFF